MGRKVNFTEGTESNISKNQRFQFALKYSMQIYKSNSLYTIIPKNACSTMRYSIAINNGFIDSPKDIHWIHNNSNSFIADFKSLITADYTFVILRCPYARLASTFLDRFVRMTPDTFRYYANMGRHINYKTTNLTFRNFVKSLFNQSIFNSNIHWKQQVDFLIYQTYDNYFSLENFDEIVQTLKNKINLKVIDARKLTNHGIDGLNIITDNLCHSDTPIIDLINMRNNNQIIPPMTLYDTQIYSDVTILYKHDLNLYKNKIGEIPFSKPNI